MLSPVETLCDAFRRMWGVDVPRSQTLARLIQHERQCEEWWKCELATHLWDVADRFGENVCVWLESFDRADVALATGMRVGERWKPVTTTGAVCIPIELKMIGTFWGAGNVEKAYQEHGKKRLEHDMLDAKRGRRQGHPFSAVALLVTHIGTRSDATLERYLQRARELGEEHGLERVLDEAIILPPSDEPTEAHQLLWVVSSAST